MAHYFVGDIQGCFIELTRLLDNVDFNPSKDELWAVGDLVARGPDSLKVMELFLSLGNAAKTVLGNHDLHLLSLINRVKTAKKSDQLAPLLASSNQSAFVDFIRHQPLMRELPQYNLVMCHAGVPPQWTIDNLRQESAQVSDALLQKNYLTDLINQMYTQESENWDPSATGITRLRYCINALTRMRYLHQNGALDFQCKISPTDISNQDLRPWFEFSHQLPKNTRIVFGHWAALMGKTNNPNYIALDTGCCWGGEMTLWHLETNEKIIQPAIK